MGDPYGQRTSSQFGVIARVHLDLQSRTAATSGHFSERLLPFWVSQRKMHDDNYASLPDLLKGIVEIFGHIDNADNCLRILNKATTVGSNMRGSTILNNDESAKHLFKTDEENRGIQTDGPAVNGQSS
jgi:hypothetical protein